MNFIAHRGDARKHPENSLQAFKAVLDHRSCNDNLIGIELDIHLTADCCIPVMHETEVVGEDGAVVPVSRLSFDALQRYYKERGGGIPDIDATLELVAHKIELCFEVKEGDYDLAQFTERFSRALAVYKPADDVVVSSFSPKILAFMQPLLTQWNLRYALIFKTWDSYDALPASFRSTLTYLNPWYRLVLDDPARFIACNLPIQCWTVNSNNDIQELIQLSNRLPLRAIMTDNIDNATLFRSATL